MLVIQPQECNLLIEAEFKCKIMFLSTLLIPWLCSYILIAKCFTCKVESIRALIISKYWGRHVEVVILENILLQSAPVKLNADIL